MHQLMLAYALIGLTSVTFAAETEKFPGIKKIMTTEEYLQSGLSKLSASEITALNQWLVRYTANDAKVMRMNVKEVKDESQKAIHSHIDGEFTGWRGETVFRLKNGQVWKQRLRGRWKTKRLDPKVTISRNLFGFYDLEIVEAQKKIGVKRLR